MLTQVADGVLVHRSEVLANNAVVVHGDGGVLVVDPGLTESELTCLAHDLRQSGQSVVAGFATHPDWDHVLWHDELGDAPRYGTAGCAAFMQDFLAKPDWKANAAEGLPPEIADETPLELFGRITGLPQGVTELPWDGPRVRVVEHPAHSTGHAALLIEDRGVLIAGDMLSDVFVPMLDNWTDTNDPVEEYLTGLRLLEDAAGGVEVVVPGHGSVGRGDQVRTRFAQDAAYIHALRDGRDPNDGRIDSPPPGWEWVSSIHEGQAQSVAAHRSQGS